MKKLSNYSVGGAATTTMVTAILPTISTTTEKEVSAIRESNQAFSPSSAAETTTARMNNQHPVTGQSKRAVSFTIPARLAGTVGLTTGFGALVALLVFLRLPFFIEQRGADPSRALSYSYYIVGALAIILSSICFLGLRHLRGEDSKGWTMLLKGGVEEVEVSKRSNELLESVKLGFKNRSLGLAYLGGFVARASSVGISTFIPLFVNTYYISSGFCDAKGHDMEDLKKRCRGAYVLSAQLTGVSQTAALVFALVFGFSGGKWRRSNAPLIIAALVGFVGYIALAMLNSPNTTGQNGTPFVYLIMAMLGVGQIGAIVCSLGLLGQCVLGIESDHSRSDLPIQAARDAGTTDPNGNEAEESTWLIQTPEAGKSYEDIKGTIAGYVLGTDIMQASLPTTPDFVEYARLGFRFNTNQ
ncbi:MAG: hypothetical protein Q9217_005934 [Psora testacea]